MANSDATPFVAAGVSTPPSVRAALHRGLVIPACPLALNASRRLDERRQRALLRYYHAAGAGGVAVGVHTTQFAIRDPKHALFEPVLTLAAEEFKNDPRRLVRIGGVCGLTSQAVHEATLLRELGYDAALISLATLKSATEAEMVAHCCEIARIIPIVGFYLQPAVGGKVLPRSFWQKFAEIENVVAIKIAPFNRYQTLDVIHAVKDSGRTDIALYTGNDDNIVLDLISPYPVRIVGGLLGHWSVWTQKAVELLAKCHSEPVSPEMLQLANEVTDSNAAFFDAANAFHGCIAGLHEILRRQGLLEGLWCLDEHETLSPGQLAEIDRVCAAYPHLSDDEFVSEHRDEWLR
ncbi:MAG: dihydrodipicolinate synthase family protein [Verrucomicrobiaceae bacterium]|nr:dihydrodipicolinate synthase family protein [Verrucomicrobiaceae bacterium]